jgi:DNA-binding response OmpR family regulator
LLEAGACAYLSKPIDVKQFVDVVNEYAPRYSQRRSDAA